MMRRESIGSEEGGKKESMFFFFFFFFPFLFLVEVGTGQNKAGRAFLFEGGGGAAGREMNDTGSGTEAGPFLRLRR